MHTRLIFLIAPAVMLYATVASAPGTQAPDPQAKAQIDLGRKVYAGNPGGALCVVCHGPAGKGIPGAGPDLTDAAWVNGDGSPAFLREVISTGVPAPKQSATAMPPFGGGKLNKQQVEAVATYIASLAKK